MKNTKLVQRKTLKLSDFRGVDFSSQMTDIRNFRASNMTNFVNKYGVNHKRNGWTEIVRAVDENKNPQEINGIFDFNATTIVYAGTCFYKLTKTEGVYSLESLMDTCTDESVAIDENRLVSRKIQMFILRGMAYFVGCGDFLVYGDFGGSEYELRRVYDSENVVIPVTTKNITPTSETDERETESEPNLLTKKRKNWLIGNQNASNSWFLDTKLEINSNVLIELETKENNVNVKYLIENNNSSDKSKLYKTKFNGVSMTATECGSIDFSNGTLTLNCSTEPQISGLFNIEVTFSADDIDPELILSADYGKLFSFNDGESRLFVGGIYSKNNCYYSECVNPNYFKKSSKLSVGSDASSVIGFLRVNDDTLAVIKKNSSQEPSIYYISGKSTTPVISAGVGGISIVSGDVCAEFAGESLILTENGVYAISILNDLTSSKTLRERSRLIREKLKNCDLTDVSVTVFQGKFYLGIDGECFVADSAYKATDAGELPGDYGYEWWLWSNTPARVWFDYRGKLYFGTKNGQICMFDDDYCDREFEQTQIGDLLVSISDNQILFNSTNVNVRENDRICFNDHVYVKFLDTDEIVGVQNNRIQVSPEKISELVNGTVVFAENTTDTGLQTNKIYYVEQIDIGNCTFRLETEDGYVANVTDTGFKLVESLKGKEIIIKDVQNSTFCLTSGAASESLYSLVSYLGNTPANITARISNVTPVCAEWQTPVFDMGESNKFKTLLGLSIATEKTPGGAVSFGFDTKNISKQMISQGVKAFNFALLNFEDFSFDCGFVSAFSVMTRHKFNYIIFHFKSDNAFDCVVTNITATYKVGGLTKGVK